MVKLQSVKESNVTLKSTASGQVAFFVGATSGLALATLLEYARSSNQPKVYIVGRGEAKLAGIIEQLEKINPEGKYVAIQSEISLLRNIDVACEEVKSKEKRLDLLLMCPGYVKLSRVDNEDGIEETMSLRYYGRMRFVHNLLPLLTASPTARIVSIHGAGKEGKLIESDLELKDNFSLMNGATHTATMNTLFLAELASRYSTISCVHVFPGVVITPAFEKFDKDWAAPLRWMFRRVVLPFVGLFCLSLQESGERHLFHATSARYPPASEKKSPSAGVELPKQVKVANGEDGKEGSGCYLLNWDGETLGDPKLLDEYRKREMGKKIWEHTHEIFDRVLSKK